jgi:hypothetical protein
MTRAEEIAAQAAFLAAREPTKCPTVYAVPTVNSVTRDEARDRLKSLQLRDLSLSTVNARRGRRRRTQSASL